MADLGKIGITYDGVGYVETTPYEPLTVLKYTDGGTYMSIFPTTGHLPTDTTYWACMVPPTEASIIDYTPLAGGVITNTTVQGAIEQADSLKFNKASVVQTNVNNSETVPNSALLYSLNAALNSNIETKNISVTWISSESHNIVAKRVGNVCHIRGYCYIPSAISSGSHVDLVRINDHAPSNVDINRLSQISDGTFIKAGQIAKVTCGIDGVIACGYATTGGFVSWDFTYIA